MTAKKKLPTKSLKPTAWDDGVPMEPVAEKEYAVIDEGTVHLDATGKIELRSTKYPKARFDDAHVAPTSRIDRVVTKVLARGGYISDVERLSVAKLALEEIAKGSRSDLRAIAQAALRVV